MQYELSSAAERDIEDIYNFTAAEFGVEQAVTYLQRIEDSLSTLTANPEMGRLRPEIRAELRSMPIESHVLFYRIAGPRLRVVRILHASRDLPRQFED